MKKILSILLLMLMVFTCVNVSAYTPITVTIDSKQVEFDVAPINHKGRVLVPVRAIFEALGAEVLWEPKTATVTSSLNGITIEMTVDNTLMTVNGNEIILDVPPIIVSDRTLVPVRAISEAFGANVEWNSIINRVSISTASLAPSPEELKTQTFSKKLADGSTSEKVIFTVTYPDKYDISTISADGTDFNIINESDSHYAELSIRTDIYTGDAFPMTADYAKSFAKSIASAVHGTYISGKIATISDREFIEVRYHGKVNSESMGDMNTNVVYYTTVNDGVVYTMTSITYGKVPTKVITDIDYVMKSLIIQ